MVSICSRYWFLISFIFLFSACQQAENQLGEEIPATSVFGKEDNINQRIAYLNALIEDQDGAPLYYLRSRAYFDIRSYAKADEDIKKALEEVPNDIDYLMLSARISTKLSHFAEALEHVKAVASTGLQSPTLNLLFADIYRSINSKRLAAKYLQDANQMGLPASEKVYSQYLKRFIDGDSLGAASIIQFKDTNHPDLAHAYYFYQLGRISNLSYQGQILGAIKLHPADPFLMQAWARFLVHVRQFARAENVYRHVYVTLADNTALSLELGLFYFNLKKYPQAMMYFNRIPDKSIDGPSAFYYRFLVNLFFGKKSASISVLDSAKRLYPGDSRFRLLYDRLTGKRVDSTEMQADSTAKKLID